MTNPLISLLMQIAVNTCDNCIERKCLEERYPYTCPKLQDAFKQQVGL